MSPTRFPSRVICSNDSQLGEFFIFIFFKGYLEKRGTWKGTLHGQCVREYLVECVYSVIFHLNFFKPFGKTCDIIFKSRNTVCIHNYFNILYI